MRTLILSASLAGVMLCGAAHAGLDEDFYTAVQRCSSLSGTVGSLYSFHEMCESGTVQGTPANLTLAQRDAACHALYRLMKACNPNTMDLPYDAPISSENVPAADAAPVATIPSEPATPAVSTSRTAGNDNAAGGALVMVMVLMLYLMPALIGFIRQRPNSVAILVVNLFLGWTLIFWVLSLAWAVSSTGQSIKSSS